MLNAGRILYHKIMVEDGQSSDKLMVMGVKHLGGFNLMIEAPGVWKCYTLFKNFKSIIHCGKWFCEVYIDCFDSIFSSFKQLLETLLKIEKNKLPKVKIKWNFWTIGVNVWIMFSTQKKS